MTPRQINAEKMQHFPVTEIQNTESKALHQAGIEPAVLTADSGTNYVIMSVANYQQLIDRLDRLEDLAIGQLAQAALSTSHMVGTEAFTAELQRLATMDSSD